MTSSLFFQIAEGEDPVDKYEEHLFEDKLFFKTKPLIRVVFEARLKKMQQRQEAFDALFPGWTPMDESTKSQAAYLFGSTLRQQFKDYFAFKNSLLVLVFQARNIGSLTVQVQQLLSLNAAFLKSLFENQEQTTTPENTQFSKLQDEVALASALREMEEKGGFNLTDAYSFDYLGKELLTDELNRLFLHQQKERTDGYI